MNTLSKMAMVTISTLFFCISAFAQKAAHPVAVTVTCSCDDATGKAYVSALRAALARNKRYKEVNAAQGANGDAIRINIISMALAEDQGHPQSALSIVCLHDGALMHQFLETCTHIPIEDCAQSMIDSLASWDGPTA